MVSQSPVTHRILGEVKRMHGCDLDSLAKNLPDLSWNQVFLEIDRFDQSNDFTFCSSSCSRSTRGRGRESQW